MRVSVTAYVAAVMCVLGGTAATRPPVLFGAASVAQVGADATAEYEYQLPRLCGACHPDHYKQWQHSLHALSHSEPLYDLYFIKACTDTDQAIQEFCARCHTPVGVLDGEIPYPKPVTKLGDTAVSPTASTGVQCDFCHTISGYTELNNAAYIVDRSKTKRGPYGDSESPFHGVAYSELFTQSELCGVCHNVVHPGNGIVLESTYDEWKASPYAAEGVGCRDCHLTRGMAGPQKQPGLAAIGGPQREHVSEHYFVGPTLLYADRPGAEELRSRSEQLLRQAATLEIGDIEADADGLAIPVLVTNVGAGHSIPTGITELRQVWLEVVVTDATGQVVLHSGALDEAGEIEPGAVVYTTIVKDATGTPTTRFWNTVEKASDYRVPPRETMRELFRLPAGQGAEGPLNVSARLHYRSVSPYGLSEVDAPEGMVVVPVFTMASSERTVAVP